MPTEFDTGAGADRREAGVQNPVRKTSSASSTPIRGASDNATIMTVESAYTQFRWTCLLIAATVVFQLFHLGAQPFAAGLIPEPWDKLAHFAVYSLITVLLWIGTAGRMTLAVLATVVAIGALDELRQAGIHGRSADTFDFLADVCAGIATTEAMLLHGRKTIQDR
jgi:VanZ family protein